jgi:hypothetical protein
MDKIIEFPTKDIEDSEEDISELESPIEEILSDMLLAKDSIKDVLIFFKDTNNQRYMFSTDMSLEDKSVFVQLLQHSIYEELVPTQNVTFESEEDDS